MLSITLVVELWTFRSVSKHEWKYCSYKTRVKISIVNMNKDICVICEVEIENEDDCSTLTEKR